MRRLSFRRKEARNDAANERGSRNYSRISLAIGRGPVGTADKLSASKIISCRSLLEIVAEVWLVEIVNQSRLSPTARAGRNDTPRCRFDPNRECAKRAAARPINARLIGIINFYRGGI